MSIKVNSVVKAYEKNGEQIKGLNYPLIEISSHWNRREFVILQIEDGEKLTFLANDLIAAIVNAQNAAH